MKLCFVIFAVIGLTYGAPKPRDVSPLQQDVNDFLALVPVDQIRDIVLEAILTDSEVQEIAAYILSPEFKAVAEDVEAQQSVKDIVKYLDDKGVDIISLINELNLLLGIPPWGTFKIHQNNKINPTTWRDVYEKIKALIPVEEIKALWYDKLENSPSWKELIDLISSDESHQKVHELVNRESVQSVLAKLTGWGVDLDKIAAVIEKALGWDSIFFADDVSPLQKDVDDFLALIPVDQIRDIILEAILTDSEVQEIAAYILSPEFKAVVEDVEAQQSVKDIVAYLQSKGVDIISLINELNLLLGIPPWGTFKIHQNNKINPTTWRDVYEKIKALIPVEEIKALWYDKLENSPSWKELIDLISSDESHQKVHELVNRESVQSVLAKLTGWGVDLDKIAAVIEKALGWDSIFFADDVSPLQKDVDDFLALIPVDQIRDIILEAILTDSEVQEIAAYILSPEFKAVVEDVEAQQSVKDIVAYLQSKGVDIISLINLLNSLLGIPPWGTFKIHQNNKINPTTWRDVYEKIKALIPVEEIKALWYDKLENSPSWKELIDLISSDESHQKVHELVNRESVQSVLAKLTGWGVDLDKIAAVIEKALGWDSI